jgi:hypothetical protein
VELNTDKSAVPDIDWPRSDVTIPTSSNSRKLSEEELAVWNSLEERYAPFVLGDEVADYKAIELPALLSVGWCSLYPLAIFSMRGSEKPNFSAAVAHRPTGPAWLPWDHLLTEFWKRRESQLRAFRTFLADWGLSRLLGTSHEGTNAEAQISHEPPFEDDRKVLGFHRFQAWDEVADYALRWAENPLIRETHLWQHRITVSRGIDLICSELLANGFEHSGTEGSEVFIMAKLCSHKSAWRALELDKTTPYLTPTETHFFKLAEAHKCPLLQLCIGDTGQGFGGNERLRNEYGKLSRDTGSTVDEAKLIAFALSGKVSTKTREHHRTFWKGRMEGEPDLAPTNHGLAEVRRFVRKMHGYWRIHSRAVALDQDFLSEPSNTGHFPTPVAKEVQPIPGCLHYFMFPLLPEETLPTHRSVHRAGGSKGFHLIDASDDRVKNDRLQTGTSRPEEWVGPFCDRIVEAHDTGAGAALIHLAAFDHLTKQDLETASLDLVRCLHYVRDGLGVFLSGANEEIRYQLARYTSLRAFDLEYRVLPFVHFTALDGELRLELGCSDVLRDIEKELLSVLNGDEGIEILKSDNRERWELFRRVHAENQGLFQISSISTAGDEVFRAQVQVPLDASDSLSLLCGGMSFSDFKAFLLLHTAVAPFADEGYFRLGEQLPTYVHLGRLWADSAFQFHVTNWLRIAFIRSQAANPGIGSDGSGLVLIAVLHPAIELSHELIRCPSFANAEIVEVRRVSDLRWDFEPLLKVRGKKAAILIDIVLTGSTVRRIVQIVEHIGLALRFFQCAGVNWGFLSTPSVKALHKS